MLQEQLEPPLLAVSGTAVASFGGGTYDLPELIPMRSC